MPKRMSSRAKKNAPAGFLMKTFQILENPQYAHIISWVDDGRAFSVKNVVEFSTLVLPKYFKHSNYASFIRQLNMYDFHKRKTNQNDNIFEHDQFRKGQPSLLSNIKRKVVENSQSNLYVSTRRSDADYRIQEKQSQLQEFCRKIHRQNEMIVKENLQLKQNLAQIHQQRKNNKMFFYYLVNLLSDKDNKVLPDFQSLKGTNSLQSPFQDFSINNIFNLFFKKTGNKRSRKLGLKAEGEWQQSKQLSLEQQLYDEQMSPFPIKEKQQDFELSQLLS